MPKHEAMDIETVADLLGGISERQVRNYVAAGMPSQKAGRTRTFNWYEVLEWYVGYKAALEAGDRPLPVDEEEADEIPEVSQAEDIRAVNLRRGRADANLKELQLSKLRGEVITIADAKVRLDRMLGNLRARLLGMAPKLASRLEGEKSRTSREAAIKDELENLCREVSTGAIVDLPATDDKTSAVELSAAAQPVTERNGMTNLEILANVAELLEHYDPFEQ